MSAEAGSCFVYSISSQEPPTPPSILTMMSRVGSCLPELTSIISPGRGLNV